MNNQGLRLSIVIPTYNEDKRLGPTIVQAINYLQENLLAGEIIISDDGSKDDTLRIATLLLDRVPHQILSNSHKGKGWAVRNGVLSAKGDAILFADADLCIPFETLDKMLPWLENGYDCVIGSRHMKDSIITDCQPLPRVILGKFYILLSHILFGIPYADINCGFKLFKAQTAIHLFSIQKQVGFGFDLEILYIAKQLGIMIKEVPVTWCHKEGSKVHPICDGIFTLLSIFQLRFWLR